MDQFIIYPGFDTVAGNLSKEVKKQFFDNNLGHYIRVAEFVSSKVT